MALLPYRTEVNNGAFVTVDNFMNTTGEAGFVVSYVTSTSGVGSSFDNASAVVAFGTGPLGSGSKPAGMLLQDVVNKDLSQTHLNYYKREVQVGGKVTLAKRGTYVTNAISGGMNPTPGAAAYLNEGGYISTTNSADSTRIGTFAGSRSSDGYVKVDLNIS